VRSHAQDCMRSPTAAAVVLSPRLTLPCCRKGT
jgi:hypothetical protein